MLLPYEGDVFRGKHAVVKMNQKKLMAVFLRLFEYH